MSTTKEFAELYLQDILARLKMYKSLADDAVAQLDDEHLFAAEHWETLSIPRGASEAFNQAMRDEHNP